MSLIRVCYAFPTALVVLLIAGCGSSSPTSSSSVSGARASANHGGPSVGRDIVSRTGTIAHRPTRGTGGSEINDDNPGRADSGTGTATGPNPCKLVSRAQAQAIVGKPIASMQEAPLGPTCIYQPAGSKSFVTLAIEQINLPKVLADVRGYSKAHIKGHTADCGIYGQPTTFVALPRTEVLTITGPCAIGLQFAKKALSRLGS